MKRPTILASRVLRPGETPDILFVPPLLRRRLSPLQRIFFHLANFPDQPQPKRIVFASRDGEDALTRRIVEDFQADGSVSPNRFSTSVYNAAPGLWSVFTGNTATYTAVAAGRETVKCGLLEALLPAETPTLFVAAEETEGGHGFSFLYGFDS